MKIVLIGFMGAGKTTVAKLLAEKLNYQLIELDDEILALSPRKNIPEIFELDGEKEFRKLEHQALSLAIEKNDIVISTGGGVAGEKINRELLSASDCKVIFLQADFQTLQERVGKDPNRPLFLDPEKAKKLFLEREAYYREIADEVVDTTSLTVEEVSKLCIVN